jgi:energy-coupling factor transport system ATP-binding protein
MTKHKNSTNLAAYIACGVAVGSAVGTAAAMMMSSETLKLETLLACYITGLPMDLVHAFGAAIFLMIAAEPMLEKMDRIKVKYGIAD